MHVVMIMLSMQGASLSMMQDAVVMLLGTIMLAVANGTTTNGWVVMYAIAQLVFGSGVGGEPVSSWVRYACAKHSACKHAQNQNQ